MTKPRILLVEDNNINQVVAQKILSQVGLSADLAGTAETALEKLNDTTFDLVLMDVRLPGMDGLEAARRIRAGDAGSKNSEVAIIALTAYASDEDRDACLQTGMNDYLSKPLDITSFLETVQKYVTPTDQSEGATDSSSQSHEASTDAATEHAIFDAETLKLQLGGDENLAGVAVSSFLGLLPRKLRRLHDAVSAADGEEIQQAAHALAGAAGNVAAVALQSSLRSLEEQAGRKDLDSIAAGIMEVDELAEETRLALERFRAEHSG